MAYVAHCPAIWDQERRFPFVLQIVCPEALTKFLGFVEIDIRQKGRKDQQNQANRYDGPAPNGDSQVQDSRAESHGIPGKGIFSFKRLSS